MEKVDAYAGVIFTRPDGAVILQQRDDNPDIDNPGKLSSFGGGLKPGEEPAEAAAREVSEETNLQPTKNDLEFLRKYRKTQEVHGCDEDAYYFVLRGVDDTHLEVYEGQGFVVIEDRIAAAGLPIALLTRQALDDFYEASQR